MQQPPFDPNPYAAPAPSSVESKPGALLQAKKQVQQRMVLLVVVVVIALPISVGIVGMRHVPQREAALLAVPLLIAAMFSVTLAMRYWSDFGYGSLGRQVAGLLGQEGINSDAWSGRYVQFAPSGQLRLYDNHTEWDVGFFFLFRDRCTYLGTQARFTIPRSAIRIVSIGHGNIEPPMSYQVRVHWLHPTTGTSEVFSVWDGVPKTFFHRFPESEEFAGKIRSWASAPDSCADAPSWSELPVPDFQQVEGKAWQEANPLWLQMVGAIGLVGIVFGAIAFAGVHLQLDRQPWWPIASSSSLFLYIVLSTLPRFAVRDVVPF